MVIGIDPGASKPHALAIIHNEKLIHVGPVSRELGTIVDWLNMYRPNVVAIEGQYAGPNIKVLIQLAEARGKLIAVCELTGVKYEIIQPQQWMNSIGLNSRTKRGPARDKWIIKMAKEISKGLSMPDSIDIDQACAIHIANFAFKRLCFKKKVQR